jgi:tetratricopeptide (TPR) repeat protein
LKRPLIICLLALTVITFWASCSTEKNTAKTRWWQAFNTRYNVYFNGKQAYIEGSLAKEQGNVDNFTEMIPLYTVGNKQSRELGKSNFDVTIEKMEKAIKLHSIKRRPVWDKNRRKTARDREWLSRREYNPFLWKAWLLMGRAQFHEGDFDGAASTFSYMSRLYATQPAIYGRARAWLAKAYVENDLLYDAEDVIRNMQRDSIHWRARKEWDYTYADYYIHTGDYAQAVVYLRRVIKHEMRRKQKAREYYLLGQLEQALGNNEAAYKAFRKVVKMNPPYELEFNARVASTEVLAKSQAKKTIKLLKRMAASDKNKDYLDQVYYALGNVFLTQGDTLQAISNYEKGNEKSTRTGIEKGVLLLKLGDLYWEREQFSDAQRCYNGALGMLDKERKDYEQLSERSKVLDELVPYTEAVHLQDSLQTLAKMDEKDRNAAIDRVIEALKKKEKEERDKQLEAEAQQNQQNNGQQGSQLKPSTSTSGTSQQQAGTWYFYNPVAVQRGKQQFERLWGKRENVDNWQRSNKTVVAGLADEQAELTDEQRDSLDRVEALQDSLDNVADSAQNDPHRREYYLAQIPFTPEQVEQSNQTIMDGLFHSGIIFKDKLDNLPLSEKALTRIVDQYPDYEQMDQVYYHLFLLYSRQNEPARAEGYVSLLKQKFPESQYTTLLTDPYYVQNAKFGTHLEDSLYAATYEAFKADRFNEVRANSQLSAKRFPLGANRDKFIFIDGMGKLNSGDGEGCLKDMQTVVEKYPESSVAELAGMIVNGVQQGRRLRGGKFDMGDVWQRRAAVLADSDSLQARKFSNERNTKFVFMFVYQPDSLNENKLLFQLARHNFTSYLVRDFVITIEDADGLHQMKVSGFRNFDEALLYARQLYDRPDVVKWARGARPFIISEENLPLIGTNFSYDDYDKFYAKHFAPLKVRQFYLLTEPAEVTTVPEKEPVPSEKEIDDYLNGTFISPEEELEPKSNGTNIPTEQPTTPEQPATVIPAEPAQQPTESGTTIVPESGVTVPTAPTKPTTPTQPTKPATETPVKQANEQPVQTGTTVIPESGVTVPTAPTKPTTHTQPTKPVTETPVKQANEQPVQTGTTVIPESGVTIPTAPTKPTTPTQPTKPATNTPVKQTTEQPVQTGTTVVPLEQENQPTQQGVTIPLEPDQQSGQSGTTVIPESGVTVPTAPTKPTTPTQPTKAPTKTSTQKPATTPAKKTATPVKKTEKTKKVMPIEQEGVDIYFDDSSVVPPSKSKSKAKKKDEKKKEEKKATNFELEDEYYELDGF